MFPGSRPSRNGLTRFTAAHRPAFFRISLLLWGRNHEPPRYDLVSFLFLRLLGLVYLAAFVSFAVQAQGLIGSHGILPVSELVDNIAGRFGPERFFLVPMVFWINDSDTAIQAVCWAGAVLSLLLVLNVLPRLCLFLLFALYLSLLYAGQAFMTYQWDLFLLEMGFAAFLMSFATRPGIWLLRWLMFRFMFMSGVVKLLSGDPNWWNMSALSYHFLTQPLPTTLAWYAAQLPPGVLKFATSTMFVVELVLPFFIFAPRRLRFIAAFGFLLLEVLHPHHRQLQLVQSSNHVAVPAAVRRRRVAKRAAAPPRSSCSRNLVAPRPAVTAVVSVIGAADRVLQPGADGAAFRRRSRRRGRKRSAGWIGPLNVVSGYGLFSIMTTTRHEIVIEGSHDGVEWREYEFRYKPGDLTRAPPWNIPHQPRLDWQMWFAALDDPQRLPWFWRFLERLLQNEPTVTALLEDNPFADKPPLYVRAQFYDYTFPSSEERAAGRWWDRRLLGSYFQPVHLKVRPGQ